MKKIILIMLALTFMLTLFSCGKEDSTSKTPETTAGKVTQTTAAPETTKTPETTFASAHVYTVEEIKAFIDSVDKNDNELKNRKSISSVNCDVKMQGITISIKSQEEEYEKNIGSDDYCYMSSTVTESLGKKETESKTFIDGKAYFAKNDLKYCASTTKEEFNSDVSDNDTDMDVSFDDFANWSMETVENGTNVLFDTPTVDSDIFKMLPESNNIENAEIKSVSGKVFINKNGLTENVEITLEVNSVVAENQCEMLAVISQKIYAEEAFEISAPADADKYCVSEDIALLDTIDAAYESYVQVKSGETLNKADYTLKYGEDTDIYILKRELKFDITDTAVTFDEKCYSENTDEKLEVTAHYKDGKLEYSDGTKTDYSADEALTYLTETNQMTYMSTESYTEIKSISVKDGITKVEFVITDEDAEDRLYTTLSVFGLDSAAFEHVNVESVVQYGVIEYGADGQYKSECVLEGKTSFNEQLLNIKYVYSNELIK